MINSQVKHINFLTNSVFEMVQSQYPRVQNAAWINWITQIAARNRLPGLFQQPHIIHRHVLANSSITGLGTSTLTYS